jgi:hypothetical protein
MHDRPCGCLAGGLREAHLIVTPTTSAIMHRRSLRFHPESNTAQLRLLMRSTHLQKTIRIIHQPVALIPSTQRKHVESVLDRLHGLATLSVMQRRSRFLQVEIGKTTIHKS